MDLLRALFEQKAGVTTYDDRIMGGASHSSAILERDCLLFEGTVKTENNGGFCSFRISFTPIDVAKFSAVQIACSATDRDFELRLFNEPERNAIAYRYKFTPRIEGSIIEAPFSQLVPVFRGKELCPGNTFNPGRLCAIGFLTGKRKPGSFSLKVSQLELVKKYTA